MATLYLKDSFTRQDIRYLISCIIREYDISKANISILLNEGCITPEQYTYYYNLDKRSREYLIGTLQRDNEEINKTLNGSFKKYRQLFFEANGIEDDDVLSIKKDAIYLINKDAPNVDFGHVHFSNKHTFTSYYKILSNEYLYSLDSVHNVEYMEVKGMSVNMYKHDNYFNDLLKCLFECAEYSDIEEAITIGTTFLDNYMNEKVELEFYREYNSRSGFRISNGSSSTYYFDIGDPNMVQYYDKSYNRNLIEILLSYYSEIYINKMKNRI